MQRIFLVIDEWNELEEWQDYRPAIQVVDEIAYIVDPEELVINAVDLTEFEIIETADLDFVPNELTAVDGEPAYGVCSERASNSRCLTVEKQQSDDRVALE